MSADDVESPRLAANDQESETANYSELELTPTPRRRQSNISMHSSHGANLTFPLNSTPNATYDSGNYSSDCSNISDSIVAVDIDLPNTSAATSKGKEDDIFFTLKDVVRLQSEMQRLQVSEQWYKEELRQQSATRLDVLERLYAQERKYMKENQKLQRECMRLYAKCSELESELSERSEKAMDHLPRKSGTQSEEVDVSLDESTFEIEQQSALIKDQRELISVLRKQKRALLEDLERLGVEKDDRVSELQRMLSEMETGYRRVTGECAELHKIRRELEKTLEERTTNWEMDANEQQQQTTEITELRDQLTAKEELLMSREREISELQSQFKAQLENTTNVDELQRLRLSYHAEISAKTAEISGLKAALHALQEELVEQDKRTNLIEEQERTIEHLNFTLKTRIFQLENLQQVDANKTEKIVALELSVEGFQKAHDQALLELQTTKGTLRSVEQELIALNTQYANMCALCERTKLELELQKIDHGKRRFEASSDARDIEELRDKLKKYLAKTAEMSSRISTLETEQQESRKKKTEIQNRLANATRSLEEEKERCAALTEALRAQETQMAECRAEVALKCRFWETELAAQANKYQHEILELRQMVRLSEENVERLKEDNQRLQVESDNEDDVVSRRSMTEEQYNKLLTVQQLERELQAQQEHTTELCKENQRLKLHIQELDELPAETFHAELAKLTAQNEQLRENQKRQQELFAEKEKLLERFKNIISNEAEMHKLLIQNNIINTTEDEKPQTNTKLQQTAAIMESLIQQNQTLYRNYKTTEHYKLQMELRETNERCEQLQRQLQGKNIDYEDERAPGNIRQSPKNKTNNLVNEECEELLEENDGIQLVMAHRTIEELRKEFRIQTEHATKPVKTQQDSNEVEILAAQLEHPTKQDKTQDGVEAIASNRVENLAALEPSKPQVSATFHSRESDEQHRELLSLRALVGELREQLEISSRVEDEKRAERIGLINKLLAQQHEKVQQLQAAQVDWEELLKALNDTQRLEEQTREELNVKSAELEELNKLFEKQNKELRELHRQHLVAREKLAEETDKLRETFQQEASVLQEQLNLQSAENVDQKRRIEELTRKNESYSHDLSDLSELNTSEMAAHKRQLRTLQAQLEKQLQERESEAEARKELEKELSAMKKGQRVAVLMPPELVLFSGSEESGTDSDGTASHTLTAESMENSRSSDARLRILTKVLESEYERKIQRYNLHIHTLLSNVKSLKKALKAAEQKSAQLRGEQTRTADELQELQTAKRHADELRLKCDQSQRTIKMLEQALETERQRYAVIDEGKETQTKVADTHEVSNLIDDYKKLIQQSAAATQRPQTRAVLELIQRSNQCTPNLQQLESNISELSSDLHAFIAAYAQNVGSRTLTQDALKAQPSLLDELRVASEII